MHLYLHIPFCKQACFYCDFHFSVNLQKKSDLVKGIIDELSLQQDFLKNKSLTTIYLGGGSPSLLSNTELEQIFRQITNIYPIAKNAEITLEVNPDDVNDENLTLWKSLGINRISLGVQSFNENSLSFLNRAHTATEAQNALEFIFNAGFERVSLDLIYAIPCESNDIWKNDLAVAFSYPINHLSAYALTIEEKTVFGKRKLKGNFSEMEDALISEQFELLLEESAKAGFEQYEISNFARNEQYAIHNTAYWQGDEYLGVGPSAHSFDTQSRYWNIANNGLYLKAINNQKIPATSEILSIKDKANERLMTGLRTKWGVNKEDFKGLNQYTDFLDAVEKFENRGLLEERNGQIYLTQKGKLMADRVSSDLFFE